MFILSNSYQLKNMKNDIFTTIFDLKSPVSFFVTTGEIKAYSVNTDLYSLTNKKSKKISDLKSEITCLTTHNSLICAGTHAGEVHIFSEHKTAIRQFKNHSGEITDILITPSNLAITAAKDGKINIYDLIDGIKKHSIQLSSGYVRKMIFTENFLILFSKNISVYSSKDFLLIKEIQLGKVVEHATQMENGDIFFTSRNIGGLLNLESFSVSEQTVLHTREISMIQVYDGKIYTCSVDGHLKSFTSDLKCISDINFMTKLISFGFSNDIPLVITSEGKILSIEQKKDVIEQRRLRKSKADYAEEIEYQIVQSNKIKLNELDMLLKNYEYKKAVKYCIASNDISQTFGVLKYITDARELMKVAKDADLVFLKDLLTLCLETIKIEEFTPIIIELLMILTTRYFNEIANNEYIQEIVKNISNSLNEIVAFESLYLQTMAFVESFPSK